MRLSTAFDGIGVDVATHIFVFRVIDGLMAGELGFELAIS